VAFRRKVNVNVYIYLPFSHDLNIGLSALVSTFQRGGSSFRTPSAGLLFPERGINGLRRRRQTRSYRPAIGRYQPLVISCHCLLCAVSRARAR